MLCFLLFCDAMRCVVFCVAFFCIALFRVVCYGQRRHCSRITPGNMGVPIGPILRYVTFQSISHLYHKLALCNFAQTTILLKYFVMQSPFGQFCILYTSNESFRFIFANNIA